MDDESKLESQISAFVETEKEKWKRRDEEFPHMVLFTFDYAVNVLREIESGERKVARRERAGIIASLLDTIAAMTPNVWVARKELAQREALKSKTVNLPASNLN